MTREALRDAAKAVWRKHFVRGAFAIKVLADDAVSEVRMRKLADPEDVKSPDLADLRHLLPRMVRENRDAAIAFLSEALDLEGAGLVLSAAPRPGAGAHDLERETAEASIAAADVTREVHAATADQHISPEEAASIRRRVREAQQELAHVAEGARRFECAQGELAMEARR